MNDRIKSLGIEIIGRYTGVDSKPVLLKYKGKVIERPSYNKCEKIIFDEFGLKLPKE